MENTKAAVEVSKEGPWVALHVPKQVRIRFVDASTGKNKPVQDSLKPGERDLLRRACSEILPDLRADGPTIDDRRLLNGVGACVHEIIYRRAPNYEDGVDALYPAKHFHEFLTAFAGWGDCLDVIVTENAWKGPGGERVHVWEIQAVKNMRTALPTGGTGIPLSAAATPEEFVERFLASIHASVYEISVKLPGFFLYYENQAWLGTRYFQLSHGPRRRNFFTRSTGSIENMGGSWDGKEIPALVEAIINERSVSVTRLQSGEMPPAAVADALQLDAEQHKEMVLHKLAKALGLPPADDSNEGQPQSNIAGKPVLTVDTRIVNPDSGFKEKGLCDGPTFSPGSACVYTCQYCFTETMMNRGGSAVSETLKKTGKSFQDVVIRRNQPLNRLRAELRDTRGKLLYEQDTRTVYASPAVDVAATVELASETTDLCVEILESTGWTLRLLSKSPLLGRIAAAIPTRFKQRVIYGLSTGTLDEALARAIEPDSPLPTKRLEALKELQQEGFRTFAMLCPILPQDPVAYAKEAAKRIDFAACEHVWAEVLNRRGASMQRTAQALEEAGLITWAQQLRRVFGNDSTPAWEAYARDTFNALAGVVPAGKLRFLQYVRPESLDWWTAQEERGAILLGKTTKRAEEATSEESLRKAKRSAAAKKAWETIRRNQAKTAPALPPTAALNHNPNLAKEAQSTSSGAIPPETPGKKAWETMRRRYTPEQIKARAQAAAKKAWVTIRAKNK